MLRSLTIRNVALIDDLTVEFGPGLNVLTGETGAGKSIILEALMLALGKRAAADYIRTGAEKAVIEAVFAVQEVPQCLAESGIELEEGHLFFRRELYRQGKSLCRVNGHAVPLSLCREAAEELVEFLIQGEEQALLTPAKQLAVLDAYAGLGRLAGEVERLYRRWHAAREKAAAAAGAARARAREADTLRYQIAEIDRAAFRPGEIEELLREREWLLNAVRLTELGARARAFLTGEDHAAVESVGEAAAILAEIAKYREEMGYYAQALREAVALIVEAARELERLTDRAEHDPRRLDLVEERLELFRRLSRKYGETVEAILRFRAEAAAALETLVREEETTAGLEAEAERWLSEWQAAAARLQEGREEAARRLERAVEEELARLAMERTSFRITFAPVAQVPNPRGLQEVEFLFSPNPGEPLKPLSRIASGGEAIRTLFALKVLTAAADKVGTLFLDEVDTGISGRALEAVASRLNLLAARRQVLCITHQAVVAARGAVHYVITKEIAAGRAVVRVAPVSGAARVAEIARLVGGSPETAAEHARVLLESDGQVTPETT
ncbi:DNA replication and repair protein RecN [Thermodesulfitimonas autotrophica]|uniref:DNA repair protein RecN n=1 Tax=Thermodesulfitimonas autotrophica TaxID=1894989 RepID=A0A3N5AWL7_9THEO|nr:DNA repair protein RecN [Thermodesulfitimonas autotrophica]RPF49273.1 DNA replication and repair protein RecN [Thermodesulfitimonas autotrophica]